MSIFDSPMDALFPGTLFLPSEKSMPDNDDMVTLPADELAALLLALVTISQESTDVDAVRLSMIALYETQPGREFLRTNPIEVN